MFFVIFFPVVLTLTYHRSLIKFIIWTLVGVVGESSSVLVSWNKEKHLTCLVLGLRLLPLRHGDETDFYSVRWEQAVGGRLIKTGGLWSDGSSNGKELSVGEVLVRDDEEGGTGDGVSLGCWFWRRKERERWQRQTCKVFPRFWLLAFIASLWTCKTSNPTYSRVITSTLPRLCPAMESMGIATHSSLYHEDSECRMTASCHIDFAKFECWNLCRCRIDSVTRCWEQWIQARMQR